MQKPPPTVSDLVLVGGGHAHVHILKMLGMPVLRQVLWQQGIRVTLIAKDVHTPYSGMLPGYVAGHYSYDQIHLDLVQLCRFSNVRLVHAAASKITYKETSHTGGGMVHCWDGRPPIRYDCLSIDIGSAPAKGDQVYQQGVIPVKPIANFCDNYRALQNKWGNSSSNNNNSSSSNSNDMNNKDNGDDKKETANNKEYRICVVGGGAGGIELALSVQYNLLQTQEQPADKLQVILVTSGEYLLKGHNKGVRKIFERVLKERNIQVVYQAKVASVETLEGGRKMLVLTKDSERINPDPVIVDDCIWCVTAGVSSWLGELTPFATTEAGFLRVNDTYESLHHPGVFAAGDCCHMDKHPRPKGT
jgi:selenide,water dikinase